MTESAKPRAIIGGVDLTEEVAAMYDAIVGSMDWGSGFLDDESIQAILLIGRAAGFDLPESFEVPEEQTSRLPSKPWWPHCYDDPSWKEKYLEWQKDYSVRLADLRKQHLAKIDALLAERTEDTP